MHTCLFPSLRACDCESTRDLERRERFTDSVGQKVLLQPKGFFIFEILRAPQPHHRAETHSLTFLEPVCILVRGFQLLSSGAVRFQSNCCRHCFLLHSPSSAAQGKDIRFIHMFVIPNGDDVTWPYFCISIDN
ncbi:hypothetical protein AB3S75_044887 [Citrus x aurantiifolia]